MTEPTRWNKKDLYLGLQQFQATGLIGLHTAAAACAAAVSPTIIGLLKSPESELTVALQQLIGESCILSADTVTEITQELDLTVDQLMQELVLIARKKAHAPISRYKVGAVALGNSGTIYLGFNVEFPGLPLQHTIHAEQCRLSSRPRGKRLGSRCQFRASQRSNQAIFKRT